jgi:predicted transcriptional regulator
VAGCCCVALCCRAHLHLARAAQQRHPAQLVDRPPQVEAGLSLDQLISEQLAVDKLDYVLVSGQNGPHGIITLRDVLRVPRNRWFQLTAGEVSKPWRQLPAANLQDLAIVSLKRMRGAGVAEMVVLDEGQIAGIISRRAIVQYTGWLLPIPNRPAGASEKRHR